MKQPRPEWARGLLWCGGSALELRSTRHRPRVPGVEAPEWAAPMGREDAGVVEEVGSAVRSLEPARFVVGSFFTSDNTCEICRSGYEPSCPNREAFGPSGGRRRRPNNLTSTDQLQRRTVQTLAGRPMLESGLTVTFFRRALSPSAWRLSYPSGC